MVACVGFFTACEKGTLVETTEYEKVAPGDPKYSYLKILNLTPSSPVLNFLVDGKKFSANLSSSGVASTGYAYNGLFPDLGYAVVTPGTRSLTATIAPTATVDPNLEVFKQSINAAAGKYFTIFTTGVYSTATKNIPSALVLEDIKPALDTSKIFIRVVNLYNGSPNMDITRISTGVKLVSNLAYGTASPFTEIPNPGAGAAPSNAFTVTNAATGAALVTTLTVSLTKGRAYTIYFRGILGNASFPLASGFLTSFY